MKYLRMISTLIGSLLMLCGFFGFFLSFSNLSSGRTGRFYDPLPVTTINGAVVDSSGNIYWGLSNPHSIQVYDNTGVFLYRFSFPTGGGASYSFYIDSDDVIHIAVARGVGVFSIKDGYLVERRPVEGNEIAEFRTRRQNIYTDNGGNVYVLRGRGVRIYDENGNFIRAISQGLYMQMLLSPPIMVFVLILGVIVVFVSNIKFFFDMVINLAGISSFLT